MSLTIDTSMSIPFRYSNSYAVVTNKNTSSPKSQNEHLAIKQWRKVQGRRRRTCRVLRLILIFTRDSIYGIARICHANSVCLSVTRVYCIKTAERIIEILSLSESDRPIILVFRHQGSLRNSDGFTPNGGQIQGVSIFDQYAAIYRKKSNR